jgi:hypothetical protein
VDPDWCLECGGPGQQPTEPGTWCPDDLLREALDELVEARSASPADAKLTRVEVIDDSLRVFTRWDTTVTYQHDGRTLKVFTGRLPRETQG